MDSDEGLLGEAALLEDEVVRAMEKARERAGLTVEAMVRLLRPVLRLPEVPPEKKEIRNNWYAWKSRPQAIPAVALVKAARMAGTTVDDLLAQSAEPPDEGRLGRLEREVAEQGRLIEELRAEMDAGARPPLGEREQYGSSA